MHMFVYMFVTTQLVSWFAGFSFFRLFVCLLFVRFFVSSVFFERFAHLEPPLFHSNDRSMHFYLLAVSLYLLFFFFSSLFVSLLFVLYGVLILVLAFSILFCSV